MTAYYTVYPTKFPDYWDFVISRVCETCVNILLYGVLLILLVVAGYLLLHRRRACAGWRSLAAPISAMSVLATLQLGNHIWGMVLAFQILHLALQGDVLPHSPRAIQATNLYVYINMAGDLLLVTNKSALVVLIRCSYLSFYVRPSTSFVADSLFTYRCFVVWGRDGRVVAVPMFMILTTTVLGYFCAYNSDYARLGPYIDFRAAFLLSVVTNLVLMALTAGRIWWIRRDASVLAASAQWARRYETVIAIILESGAIYCFSVVLYVIVVSVLNPEKFSPLVNVARGAVPQIMNIAPALIVVRTGLGYNVDNAATEPRTRPSPPPTPGRSLSTSVIVIRAPCDSDVETRISTETREAI
ncbi:hypothetical protein FB451DRAFT_1571223 [Mycena latifolia]|nr:hypothetical protein FB451DRAFT_1571223 [Mycena latifolia]